MPEEKLLSAVQAAIELGAGVNEKGPQGNTALHGAAWLRSKAIIRYLVDKGANIEARNKKRQTAIFIAQRDGRGMGDGPRLQESPIADLLRELSTARHKKRPKNVSS